jgi:hypothetical protein
VLHHLLPQLHCHIHRISEYRQPLVLAPAPRPRLENGRGGRPTGGSQAGKRRAGSG